MIMQIKLSVFFFFYQILKLKQETDPYGSKSDRKKERKKEDKNKMALEPGGINQRDELSK